MKPNVLTPLQARMLTTLFQKGLADRGYYLTGGTALSGYYLQHRYSDDLDFFTRKPDPLHEDFRYFREIFSSSGMGIATQKVSDTYAMFFVREGGMREEGELKIEFARDVSARMAPPLVREGIVVDSFLDIAVNKVCTILSRSDPKDFCDLYFILKETHFELEYLLKRAAEKESAFDDEEGALMFATNLLNVRQFAFLPRMARDLRIEDLQAFFGPIAREMIRRLRPIGAG